MSEQRWTSSRPNFHYFLDDALSMGPVTVEVRPRHDVQSGKWYVLSWTLADGAPGHVEAQTMSVLLRKASEAEDRAEAKTGGWNG